MSTVPRNENLSVIPPMDGDTRESDPTELKAVRLAKLKKALAWMSVLVVGTSAAAGVGEVISRNSAGNPDTAPGAPTEVTPEGSDAPEAGPVAIPPVMTPEAFGSASAPQAGTVEPTPAPLEVQPVVTPEMAPEPEQSSAPDVSVVEPNPTERDI